MINRCAVYGLLPRGIVTIWRLRNSQVTVQEVRPRIDLCLPAHQSYIVVHLRYGDRGGGPTNMSPRPTEMGLPPPVWRSILNATRTAHPLGVVIVSNDASRRQKVEIGLASAGINVLRRAPCAHLSIADWAATSPLRNPDVVGRINKTVNMMRDWFLMWASAGVMVEVGDPWGSTMSTDGVARGGWCESSFSTTAALTGDVPLLTLRSLLGCSRHGEEPHFSGSKCAKHSREPAVRNTFAAGQVAAFVKAVRRKAGRHTALGR